ncbi:MAG: DNA primase [Microbacteriaceae bacterium]
MPGLIRRSDIDEVRSRTNIADVIGEQVTLKSAGGGSFKGLCPFHDERSPSFHVRPQVGFYHCFGCGEGGDVFTFLQKVDQLTFSEAVERLAARLGYELHYEDGGQASDHGNRARLLAANAAAEEFFARQLGGPEAEPGRRFLGERGFDPAAAQRFGIGFAPRGGALAAELGRQGFSAEELTAAGLVGRGERGELYDRFRSRLVWPIRDVTGATLGFGARRLLEADTGPKYLNTPETAVYKKSQVLYGLDLARRDIARGKQVVIVEGYTDVMACHLAGVTTAVATCGTAFGVEHIKVIRRLLGDADNPNVAATGEVVFTFDPDEAGQKAAQRAFAEEQRFAAQTFVAVAPDGLDPCDLRLERGDEAVRRLVRGRKPMFEFMIRRELDRHDLETAEGRAAAIRASAPIIAGIRDAALREGYAREIAKWTGVDPLDVRRYLARPPAGGGRRRGAAEPEPPDQQPRPAEVSLASLPNDPETRAERDALMAVLQRPADVGAELIGRLLTVRFVREPLAAIRDAIGLHLDALQRPDWVRTIVEEVPGGYAALAQQLAVAPLPASEDRIAGYARRLVADVVDRELFRRKRDLVGALQRTDAAADPERYRELQRELVDIEASRRSLREE